MQRRDKRARAASSTSRKQQGAQTEQAAFVEVGATTRLDQRGAVFAEYAIVMVLVTLVAAFAVALLSVPLFNLYAFAETLIGLPLP